MGNAPLSHLPCEFTYLFFQSPFFEKFQSSKFRAKNHSKLELSDSQKSFSSFPSFYSKRLNKTSQKRRKKEQRRFEKLTCQK